MDLRHFDIDEGLWEQVAPLLPDQSRKPQGGRPPLTNYQIFCGIVYRLRTGCQWKAIPERFGCGSAVHRHFQEWVRHGILDDIFEVLGRFYDEVVGIDWEWTSLDGSNVKAPKGGDDTGPNPTDRGKTGTKRHVLTDARGVPVAIELSGANVHDSKMVEGTMEAIPKNMSRNGDAPHHVCMDKAYDSKKIESYMKNQGSAPHIRRRGEPPLTGPYEGQPRRWVVERTNSWHNRFRALVIRWERKGVNYKGLVKLASGLIAFQQALNGFL